MKLTLLILFNFITGSLCLIFGVKLMTRGFERSNTGIIQKALRVFSGNVLKSFVIGTLLTALLQSSTAVTVITVGLVESGLMSLAGAVGIVYGANVGTTITAQLMSFNLEFLGLPLLTIGLLLNLAGKLPYIKTGESKNRSALKSIADIITGLGLMFVGIQIIHSGVPWLKQSEMVYGIFQSCRDNPILAILIGMAATMLVQSSSATVGITIVLFNTGIINLVAAIGLLLGDNIGTCATAQVVSLGMGTAAKRAAWAHTLYNIIGSLIALLFLNPFIDLVSWLTFLAGDESRLVANAHTVFNLLSAVIFLPFTGYYVKLIEWMIPEKPLRLGFIRPRTGISPGVPVRNALNKAHRSRAQSLHRSV